MVVSATLLIARRGKCLAGCGIHGRPARERLPPPDGDVDVLWRNLDQPGPAVRSLGCNECRASATERIEDDPPSVRTVSDCVGHEGDRLDGGMQRELASRSARNVLTRIVPNIGSVTRRPRRISLRCCLSATKERAKSVTLNV
jgi:hypothetical protein